jgi:carbonic anhydrase
MSQSEVYTSTLPFQADHSEAVAIVCSDGRFLRHSLRFLEEHLGLDQYDLLVLPGAIHPLTLANLLPKDFKTVQRKIAFLVEKRPIHRIVCIAHEDCGWYKDFKIGGLHLNLKERQLRDLQQAAQVLRSWFPHLAVDLYYARIEDGKVVFDQVG